MAFAIKAEIRDPRAKTLAINAQKTMYVGKHIAEGDTSFCSPAKMKAGPASSPVAKSLLPK